MNVQSLLERPMTAINVADIVEKNGKTIRDNNMDKIHDIPIGTLVEVKYDTWFGEGACEKVHARLWVVRHTRDCDGTPLYALSKYKKAMFVEGNVKIRGEEELWLKEEYTLDLANEIKGGYGRESLTPIEVTLKLVYGTGALCWSEDEKS
jgi:hypothetical protein